MTEQAVLYLVIFAVAYLIFMFLGIYISNAKGRSASEGAALGCLFGPFGCIIAALLPTPVPRQIASPSLREALASPNPVETIPLVVLEAEMERRLRLEEAAQEAKRKQEESAREARHKQGEAAHEAKRKQEESAREARHKQGEAAREAKRRRQAEEAGRKRFLREEAAREARSRNEAAAREVRMRAQFENQRKIAEENERSRFNTSIGLSIFMLPILFFISFLVLAVLSNSWLVVSLLFLISITPIVLTFYKYNVPKNMYIYFNCPKCGSVFCVKATSAGERGQCDRCREPLVVPRQSTISLEFEDEAPVDPIKRLAD